MSAILGIVAFSIRMWVNVPYINEMRHGQARPATSTRVLILILTSTVLFVQLREFTSWTVLFTVAEVVSALVLVLFCLKYGYGGLTRIDQACYLFFTATFIPYLFLSNNAILGLVLLCVTDFIALTPTLIKNFRHPELDSIKFYTVSLIADGLAILAADDLFNITEITYPSYLLLADFLAAVPLILWKFKKGETHANDKHQVRSSSYKLKRARAVGKSHN